MIEKREHDFDGDFGKCKGCGLYVEECLEHRWCTPITTASLSPAALREFFTLGWDDAFAGRPAMLSFGPPDGERLHIAKEIYRHGFEAGQIVMQLFPNGKDPTK